MSHAVTADESARIQAARGVACLLLVAFHVVGNLDTASHPLANDSLWRQFVYLFYPIRMPLFAFLSGFVYAYRPLLPGNASQFVLRKLRRLGLPLIVASTLMYLFDGAVSLYRARTGAGHFEAHLPELWRIYVFAFHQFWFLQVLILIFGLVVILESTRALSTPRRFALVFLVSLVCLKLVPKPPGIVFDLPRVTYLLPFFLLGLGLNRFRSRLMSPAARTWSPVLFGLAFSVHAYAVYAGHSDVTDRSSVLATVTGMSAATVSVLWLPSLDVLQWIGRRSFSIFLYHVQFAIIASFVLHSTGDVPAGIVFAVSLLAGILGPIAIERAAENIRVTRMPLLGRA